MIGKVLRSLGKRKEVEGFTKLKWKEKYPESNESIPGI